MLFFIRVIRVIRGAQFGLGASCLRPVDQGAGRQPARLTGGQADSGQAAHAAAAHLKPLGAKQISQPGYAGSISSIIACAWEPLDLSVSRMNEVTRILSAIDQGDPHAAEQLLPLVYDELRQLAA